VIMESLQAEQNERQRLAQPDRNYLARCRKLLEKQHTRRERLLPLYLDGEYEKDELDRQKAAIDRECVDLENKIREIEGRLSGAEEFITGVESVQQYCERARRGIEHYTFEDRRGVMDLLNVKGTVYRQEDGAVMFRLTGYFPTIDVSFDVGSGLKLSRVDRQRNSWML
jgi:chromosome segregation ATPase